MAQVIDELIIQFSLDSKNFSQGQQEIVAKARQLEEAARKAAQETESQAKRTTDLFQNIKRQGLEIIATFAGLRGIIGTIEKTTASLTGLGYAAKGLNIDPRILSGWEGAIEKLGMSGAIARSAFVGLQDTLSQSLIKGQVPEGLGFLSRFLPLYKAGGQTALPDIFLKVTEAVQRDFKTRPEQVAALQNIPGVSREFAVFLLQQREAIAASVRDSEELRKVTKENVEAAQALTASTARFTQALDGSAKVLTDLTSGPLTRLLNALADFFKEHPMLGAPIAVAKEAAGEAGVLGTLATVFGLRWAWSKMFGGGGASAAGGGAVAGGAASADAILMRSMLRILGPLGIFFGSTTELNTGEEEWLRKHRGGRDARPTGGSRPRIPRSAPSRNLSDADVSFADPSGNVVTMPRYGAPAAAARGGGGGLSVNSYVNAVHVHAAGDVKGAESLTAIGIAYAAKPGLREASTAFGNLGGPN